MYAIKVSASTTVEGENASAEFRTAQGGKFSLYGFYQNRQDVMSQYRLKAIINFERVCLSIISLSRRRDQTK